MASGRSRTVVGSFIGTGASLTISKVGFKPRSLDLFNQDDPAIGKHVEGMPTGVGMKQKGGTTGAAITGIVLTDTGFTIGADTDLNVDSERTWFVAHE